MKDNWEQCFAYLLREEGGFSNLKTDPGGMTNLGVTKRVWDAYTGGNATEAEMRSLTPAMVEPLYKKKYWDVIQGDLLPMGVDYTLFDYGVNSGPVRAIREAQKICMVTADGVLGPNTLAAIKSVDALSLCDEINDNRLSFLQGLSTWQYFGKGWGARVARVKARSEQMIKG